MKNRRERAKQVRQRKVTKLAAYSSKYTVRNCTIPKEVTNAAVWDMNKWYKELRESSKKNMKKGKRKPWFIMNNHTFDISIFRPNNGKAWYMEQIVQHKLAKWERKNPCPVKEDQNPPDIFEKEYVEPWKAQREIALERIRDFVVSMYDKLPLTGRFKESDNKFTKEKIAELKDYNGDGHRINELDNKSRLLKNAKKITNQVHAKRPNLMCTNLKDHHRKKGRIILPKAA